MVFKNSKWLSRVDSDDDNVRVYDNDSNSSEISISGGDGLGPPSDGCGIANELIHQEMDEQRLYNFYGETSHFKGN